MLSNINKSFLDKYSKEVKEQALAICCCNLQGNNCNDCPYKEKISLCNEMNKGVPLIYDDTDLLLKELIDSFK